MASLKETTVDGLLWGGLPLAPNLIHNGYMSKVTSGVPNGYSTYGSITLAAVHPFTKAFEGPYTASAPAGSVNDPELATQATPYWFGVYTKGPRIQRGGMGDGWHSFSDGNLLKVTGSGLTATSHCAIYMPKDLNMLGANWLFSCFVKITKGTYFTVGSDAGYSGNNTGYSVSKTVTDAGSQGWYRFSTLLGTSQITSIDGLAISMAVLPDAAGDIEAYIALPYLANATYRGVNQDSWAGSILDNLMRNGLYLDSNSTLTTSVIKADSGSNYPHSFTNTDSGNTHWVNRNNRLLTSNGTNWSSDGRDPIMALVTSGNTNAGTIANSIGLTLHNESQTNTTFSPAITFSNRSNSGDYNTVYATIIGKKTGQGADSNWSAGELHFYTMPVGAYVNNIPSLLITSASNIGIGTTVAAAALQIGGPSPTAATSGIQFGDDSDARIYRSSAGEIRMSGGFYTNTYITAGNYLQTLNNLVYPASWTATQRLEVGNAGNNAWIDGLTIAPGGIVTAYGDMRSPVFYDSNDTTYLLDPANTGTSLIIAGKIGSGVAAPSYELDFGAPSETASTDTIRFNSYNGPAGGGGGVGGATGLGTSLGTAIIWKSNYPSYTKRSAGIVQIAEGNYFRAGLAFYTNNVADATTDWTEAMRISSNSYVGIGTPTPGWKLDVNGNARIGANTNQKTFAALNVSAGENSATLYRDIDIRGNWNAGEGHAITATYGSTSGNIVGQEVFQYDGPGSRIRWGKLYHSGDSSTFTMDLISESATSAYLTVAGSVRAPIFYDTNDTNYYCDPASTSVVYLTKTTYNTASSLANSTFNVAKTILGGLHFNNGSGTNGAGKEAAITFQGGTADEAQAGIYVHNNSNEGTHMAFATTDSYATGPQIGLRIMNNGYSLFPRSYVEAGGSFRAPIFYDSNDTNYYVDPASTSSLNLINHYGANAYGGDSASVYSSYNTAASNALQFRVLHSAANVKIFNNRGTLLLNDNGNNVGVGTTNPTSNLHVKGTLGAPSDSGMFEIGDAARRGLSFGYDNSTSQGWIYCRDVGVSSRALNLNAGGFYVLGGSYAYSPNSLRAPVFYDTDDTNYYTNPAATSVLNNITLTDGNVELYKSQTVDMSNTTTYSTGNYYPVTISVPVEGCIIQVQNNLNSNIPTWATHASGFTLNLKWRTNGSGWGTTDVRRIIDQYYEAYANATICGGITQMTNSSTEVVWLRGGGNYLFKFSRNLTATAQSATYTNNSQSVTPGSTAQNTVWNSASGTWNIYNSNTISSSGMQAPIYYDGNNTGYYVDPASTSSLNVISLVGGITHPGGVYFQSTTTGASYQSHLQIRESGSGVGSTNEIYAPALGFHWAGTVASNILLESSGRIAIRNNPGTAYENFASSTCYAYNFYDLNDTTYYIDPANTGTSLITAGKIGIGSTAPDTNLQVVGHVHIGNQTTFENSGGWNKTIYLDGNVHARLRILGSAYASGKNSATETNIWVDNSVSPYSGLSTNAGSFQISAGYTTILNSARSPIFYDSDDTGYYCDPASTSVFNTINHFGANAYASDSGSTYSTYNTSASNALQFRILHSLGNVKLFNNRGALYINDNGNNVGIGTTAAATSLQIGGPSPTASTSGIQFGDDTGARIYRSTSSTITFSGSVVAGGYLYAGTYLQTGTNNIYPSAWSSTLNINVGNSANSAWITGITLAPGGIVTAYGDMRSPIFYDSDNTAYYINPASTSVLNTVNSSTLNGSIIGVNNTTSTNGYGISLYNGAVSGEPTYGIMFQGTATFGTHGSVTSDWATYFTMNNDNTRGWIFRKAGQANVASISGGGTLTVTSDVRSPVFYDSSDIAYYLDPANSTTSAILNGKVGIGTTAPSVSYKLDVNGGIHYTSSTASSDIRFKKNISIIDNALGKLESIRGVRYEWNEFINSKRDGYKLNEPTLGVIAQEVEAVFPELVTTWDLSEDCPDARGVNYEKFVPVLIQAVKELKAKNESLEARILTLEEKLK